jgi:SAM-dependent methyltransferase
MTLQQEFNRWAEAGEGPKMEQHHLDITMKTLRLMDLRPGERVLDLGCGSGWRRAFSRAWSATVRKGSPGDWPRRLRRNGSAARAASREFENILYARLGQQNSLEENFFDKVLSVESFYYYPDRIALMELFRVMAPKGRLYILINLYKDNPYSLQWVDKLKVPVHVRSAAEYADLLKAHAFEKVEWQQIPDDTPTPDDYKTKSFHSIDDLRAFKKAGALLRWRRSQTCGRLPPATRFIELFRAHWQGMADACISVPLHSQRSSTFSD